MYTLAMLSFHDARPRGVSGESFEDDDVLRADDFIRELRFRRGQLEVYFDYVRGRCVKTDHLRPRACVGKGARAHRRR